MPMSSKILGTQCILKGINSVYFREFVFLFVVASLSCMDETKFEHKKWLCCQEKFGGLMPLQEYNYLPSYLCSATETAHCDDAEYCVWVDPTLLMHMIMHNTNETDTATQERVQKVLHKIQQKKINLTPHDTKITQKDLVHRLLPTIEWNWGVCGLPGYYCLCINQKAVLLAFEPCIHATETVRMNFFMEFHRVKFMDASSIKKEFYALLNSQIPSLVDLALPVVARHKRKAAMEVLPQELKERLATVP